MDITHYLSRWTEEMNFFNDQKKLDTIYYLMEGLSYREVAEKIDEQIPYVQRVMNYLKRNRLLYWGRWTPNVYKIGMEKSIAFLDWKDREQPIGVNRKYATYANYVQAENTKVFVIYTYPRGEKNSANGDIGEPITPFYHTNTRFTVPFFKRIDDFIEKFYDVFGSIDNDEKILMGTPSFETDEIDDNPITVYICRYSEILPELTPGILASKLEQDFKDYGEIDVSYDKVKSKLNKMKEEGVIFPKNALYFNPLSYQSAVVRINTSEIYKIMATFNQFNMLTRVALTHKQNTFYFYVQYPFYQLSRVMRILDELDPNHKTYIETDFILGETIWYKWSLEKFLESRSRAR